MKPNYLFKTRRQAIARARRKYSLKDFDGAIAEWDELVERNQEDALAWLGRFDCLLKLERKNEMLDIGDRVCEMWPQSESAHNNYACILLEARQYEKACHHFDNALALAPERNMYYFNAGLAYRGAGKLNEAAVCFEHVLENEPDHQRALEFLSQLYVDFGISDKLIDLSLRLRMLRPGYTYPLQRRLYAMVNDPKIPEQEIDREVSLMRSVLINRPAPENRSGPTTVGWIVCPFSLGFLRYCMPLFKKYRDASEIRLIGYCNNPMMASDEFDTLFDEIYRTDESTPDAFSKLLATNQADVMIDSAGQTPNNLLQIYSNRLAPLHITWPFFQSRTEIALMDQAFVDEHIHPVVKPAATPAKNTISLSDRLTHLSGGQYCYQGEPSAELTAAPVSNNGYVTFGVIANPIQINQQSVDVWAGIMKKSKASKLVVTHRHLPSTLIERHLGIMFNNAGIKADRIEYRSRLQNHAERYECFADFDVLLSPFPVTDDLGLADAMWMGVPALAMANRIAGNCRAGSILSAADMTENLVVNEDEYLTRGIAIAKDHEKLSSDRHELRTQLQRAQLTDVEPFVEEFFNHVMSLSKRLH